MHVNLKRVLAFTTLLITVTTVLFFLGGCGTPGDTQTYDIDYSDSTLDEDAARYEAGDQGREAGHEAGREAFFEDPENSKDWSEAPDDGGYSDEDSGEAYEEGWEEGYTEGYEEAYDELVEEYQEEHPYGD